MLIKLTRTGDALSDGCVIITPKFNKTSAIASGIQLELAERFKHPEGFIIKKFPYNTDIDIRFVKGPKLGDWIEQYDEELNNKSMKEYVEEFFINNPDVAKSEEEAKHSNKHYFIDYPEDRKISVNAMDYESMKQELEDLKKSKSKGGRPRKTEEVEELTNE